MLNDIMTYCAKAGITTFYDYLYTVLTFPDIQTDPTEICKSKVTQPRYRPGVA